MLALLLWTLPVVVRFLPSLYVLPALGRHRFLHVHVHVLLGDGVARLDVRICRRDA